MSGLSPRHYCTLLQMMRKLKSYPKSTYCHVFGCVHYLCRAASVNREPHNVAAPGPSCSPGFEFQETQSDLRDNRGKSIHSPAASRIIGGNAVSPCDTF